MFNILIYLILYRYCRALRNILIYLILYRYCRALRKHLEYTNRKLESYESGNKPVFRLFGREEEIYEFEGKLRNEPQHFL